MLKTVDWTADRIRIMSAMWMDGQPAAQIADAIGGGATRCAIIGKCKRMGIVRSDGTARQSRVTAQLAGCATKLAKSSRQRDETAQAMVERRASGTLLRQEPQLALVSSVELPPRRPEPPLDLYAHLRSESGLRKALAGLSRPRDIGTGVV